MDASKSDDIFPVNQLSNRYDLARSAIYKRMEQLGIRPERVGQSSYINSSQLQLLDELQIFINQGLSVSEFIKARQEGLSISDFVKARQERPLPSQELSLSLTEDYFPVGQLQDRYDLARSAVYKRIEMLKITPKKIGKKSYVNATQLQLLDDLNAFIQEGGNATEFIEKKRLEQSISSISILASPGLTFHKRHAFAQFFSESLADILDIQMMQIPMGTVLIGSPDNELQRQDREDPQHEIIVHNFFMGRHPITQVQWRFVAELPSVNQSLNPQPAQCKGDTHPVEQISWFEAVEFCDRLSLYTGRPYRLPTEAEWEYACRANTTTPFHFGETITTDLANYNGADEQHGAYGRGPKGENRQTTTPVDHFGIANAFGLCDMHGNVWEWCQDPWRSTYGDDSLNRKIKAAPQSDQSTHRVARGGSWYTTPQRCRSASRIHFDPESRHADVGFRVVCSFEK